MSMPDEGDGPRQHAERHAMLAIGQEIYAFASDIYPIARSITGDGVRQTLAAIQRRVPLTIEEIPTGTAIFDWIVPKEWALRDAYIADSSGRRIVDVADHNLHIVGYSTPVKKRMTLAELKPHLHTLPQQPDLIPYKTSYYSETWGFCLSHNQLLALEDDAYDVFIDAALTDGALTYGEYLKRGESDEEILLSAHICHPSLANDNCSGVALLAQLASELADKTTRYSYRFIFAPGTIGAIAWLHRNRDNVHRLRHGLIVSNVGDGAGPVYKRSRRGTADIDRAAALVLRRLKDFPAELRDFSPYGYDERQYCSPGFDLPVGSFQRSAWGEFKEYHTSADNLNLIKPEHLGQSHRLVTEILEVLERNKTYENLSPFCEPQLGRRGLFDHKGTPEHLQNYRMALLWVLNQSDARHDLLAIAEKSGLPFEAIAIAATNLERAGLLKSG